MPPIQHICAVPHVCRWLHVIWVHHRIPVAHPVCSTWLTVWPVFLSGPHLHCQTGHSAKDSVHSGAPSGIQALFGKWVLLGHHWPRLYHMALRLSGTWIGHLCTQSYEELMEGCGTSSGLDVITGKQGAPQMSPEGQ